MGNFILQPPSYFLCSDSGISITQIWTFFDLALIRRKVSLIFFLTMSLNIYFSFHFLFYHLRVLYSLIALLSYHLLILEMIYLIVSLRKWFIVLVFKKFSSLLFILFSQPLPVYFSLLCSCWATWKLIMWTLGPCCWVWHLALLHTCCFSILCNLHIEVIIVSTKEGSCQH